jgi:tetratricopeptide (TPR) repeat protein
MARVLRFIVWLLAALFLLYWPALIGGGIALVSFRAGYTVFAIAAALVTCVYSVLIEVTGLKAVARAARKSRSLKSAVLQRQAVTSLKVFTQPYAEALPVLERTSQQTPNDPETWSRLAFALNMLDRSEEALAASEHALRLDSNHASAWARKAAALTNLGRAEEGLVACDHGLALDPRDASAWKTKGHALVLLGRSQDALSAFERISSLEADAASPRPGPFTWYTTACDLGQLGRYAEALEAYDRVLAAHPDLVAGWLGKAACLHKLGRDGEARAALRCAQKYAGQVA